MSKKVKSENYSVEYGYIKGRDFSLLFLALGTVFVAYKIGVFVAANRFPDSEIMKISLGFLFGILGHYGIDWILKLVLTDYSTKKTDSKNESFIKKSAWSLLSITVLLSLSTNTVFSEMVAKNDPVSDYKKELISKLKSDSIVVMKSLSMMNSNSEKGNQFIVESENRCKKEIESFAKSNKVFYKSYRKNKLNKRDWFWKCKSGSACTYELKMYRKTILEMERSCKEEKLAAIENMNQISNSLTTAIQLTSVDSLPSSLQELKAITSKLSEKRSSKILFFNIVLGILTIGFGLVSMLLKILLKRHREEHGQLIKDNPTRFILILNDAINRVGGIISDILHFIFFSWHEKLIASGKLKRYTVETSNVLDFTNVEEDLETDIQIERQNKEANIQLEKELELAKISEIELKRELEILLKEKREELQIIDKVRECKNCKKDINHKRSDARFCGDKCRQTFHLSTKT